MNYSAVKKTLQAKEGAAESFPFGTEAAVYKVRGKIFAILAKKDGTGSVARVNLKCDPDEAAALRDLFPAVLPGYHMNKLHWNTVLLDGTVPAGEILRMVDNSYNLVVGKLPKNKKPAGKG